MIAIDQDSGYASQTIELYLIPPTWHCETRDNYLDGLPLGCPVLCAKDLRKFIVLPRRAPETIWLTITTEPLDHAVDIRVKETVSTPSIVTTQALSIRFPSGRYRRQLVWASFARLVQEVVLADPGAQVAYVYVEYEDA